MNNKRLSIVATSAALIAGSALALSSTSAQAVEFGTYKLHNHPNGSIASPGYGLRIDELFNATPDHDNFTWDFDHDQSAVFLDYTDNGMIHIYGQSWGGIDVGSTYATGTEPGAQYTGLWDIDFWYKDVVKATGDDDAIVEADPYSVGSGSGTISMVGNPYQTMRNLVDYSGKNDYTFRFGDGNNDKGHRGHKGISGWGWINVKGENHVTAQDWLFTAKPVPEPGSTLGLLALGALGAGSMLKRKQK